MERQGHKPTEVLGFIFNLVNKSKDPVLLENHPLNFLSQQQRVPRNFGQVVLKVSEALNTI
jgi:hypothetical protein